MISAQGYALAETKAQRMAGRNRRTDRCSIPGVHGWHVVYRAGRDHPCGGGLLSVKTQGER